MSAADDVRALAAIVERVDPEQVARRMVEAFRAGIAGYGRLPERVLLGQIVEISRANVELFFRLIPDGRQPRDDDLAPFRESAKDRATEGMPLEDLLHAYRLGGRLGWQALAEAARPDEQRALLLCAELLMEYVDRVSAAVAQTYLDERQHLVSEEERRLRDLVDGLAGGGPLPAGLRELAEQIGIPVEERYRAFAATIPGAPAREHSQLAAALRRRGLLALTEGDRVAGLAPAPTAELPQLDGRALSALGEPAPRGELAPALDEARLLVDLGSRLGRSGRLSEIELLPELLLAGSPRLAAALRARVIGPLEDYASRRGTELLETLDTFLELGLDRRAAAAALHVHPNTLDYRLRRIEELTGLRLSRPRDLVLVTLALTQRALENGPDG